MGVQTTVASEMEESQLENANQCIPTLSKF